MVGAFEREAIRPNVAEKFVDMLMAVVKHPTMQLYLDNVASVGPHSEFGLRRNKGLNENLAREIMELHTLGVDGGYNQDDVREFAKILTGWSVANLRYLSPGRFAFDRARHEPGDKRLLGKTYDRESVEDGEAALRALAAHPSTARFIATKLARHFVADDPPQSAIRRLQHVFQQTGGDLGAVSKALVDLPEVWRTPLPKVKSPNELIISALRLIGRPDRAKRVMRTLRLLGQRTFSAPSPAGWPDIAENWLHPEAMIRRIVFLSDLARIYGRGRDPEALMDAVAGPMASNETAQTVRRAASAAEAVALLMISPEFQRR